MSTFDQIGEKATMRQLQRTNLGGEKVAYRSC